MNDFSPERSDSERDALIAEIYELFRDVTRTGGVSWSESAAIDHYGSEEARLLARQSDQETHWSQLVDDDRWQPGPGGTVGGFVFLDPIGFRYYLPATMIRCIHCLEDVGDVSRFLNVTSEPEFAEKALFTERQSRAIARFLWYMAQQREPSSVWLEPLECYWQLYL